MALTDKDLSAIGKVVDKNVGAKVKPLAEKIIKLDIKIDKLDKKFDTKLDKLDKKFDELFNFLDKDFSKTKREVREIKEHLDLPVAVI